MSFVSAAPLRYRSGVSVPLTISGACCTPPFALYTMAICHNMYDGDHVSGRLYVRRSCLSDMYVHGDRTWDRVIFGLQAAK